MNYVEDVVESARYTEAVMVDVVVILESDPSLTMSIIVIEALSGHGHGKADMCRSCSRSQSGGSWSVLSRFRF
jgi:hypothetical protein